MYTVLKLHYDFSLKSFRMSGYAVGIDLGTTNSCVAVFRNGHVEVIENERGERITPSWVTFKKDQVLTGNESVEESHKYLKTTVFEVKRLIGQRFSDPKVQADILRFPYKVYNDLGTPKINIDETRTFYPEEISAYILGAMRGIAVSRLGAEITRVVVTVPAYFNDAQRQATKDAAKIAGFLHICVINEPTAAAVAFNYQSKKGYKRNLLVYDFGGGTFDVSIVSVEKDKCQVLATDGDCHLGGTDIDMTLVAFIKKSFTEKYKKHIEDAPLISRRLKNICEIAKKRLSSQFNVDIELESLSGMDHTNFLLPRVRFEQLNNELFKRTIAILDKCLQDSGLSKDGIDEVILVGGSSRIPVVQEMLKNYFGKDIINKGVNPDEAVACGAAIHAHNLAGNKNEVLDVTSLSLGTNMLGDLMSVIIPRNTPIPAKAIKRYQTVMDNQTTMEFPIFQGERDIASENFELGHFSMTDLTEAAAKAVKIDVCYEIDYEGLLHVSATEINSGNSKDVQIDMQKKGLSEKQIQERIKEAEKHRESDLRRRQFEEGKYKLLSLLNDIPSYADKCEGENGKTLNAEYNSTSKWLDKASIEDLIEIEDRTKKLKDLINKVNQEIDN